MSKVLIVFGSTTGNTESVADDVSKVLERNGHNVEVVNAADAHAEHLADGYDAVLLGSSTWGDEDIELQDDFVPIYDNLEKAGLAGRKAAIFGCGDSSYPHFCGAVDALEEKAAKLGAELPVESLRIDGEPDADEVKAWAESVSAKL